MTTQTSIIAAQKAARKAAAPVTKKSDKVLLPFAFDWASYKETTDGMNMFMKRRQNFEYISYQHWLNPGDMDVETYESLLVEAVDADAQVRDDLAKIAYKRIVTHTVEAAAAIKRCAEYARETNRV
jgi:hypothetical protein